MLNKRIFVIFFLPKVEDGRVQKRNKKLHAWRANREGADLVIPARDGRIWSSLEGACKVHADKAQAAIGQLLVGSLSWSGSGQSTRAAVRRPKSPAQGCAHCLRSSIVIANRARA